jgi:hypothetical protein
MFPIPALVWTPLCLLLLMVVNMDSASSFASSDASFACDVLVLTDNILVIQAGYLLLCSEMKL